MVICMKLIFGRLAFTTKRKILVLLGCPAENPTSGGFSACQLRPQLRAWHAQSGPGCSYDGHTMAFIV